MALLLQRPRVAAAAAGLVFVGAAAALIAALGDPLAGAPTVRVPLAHRTAVAPAADTTASLAPAIDLTPTPVAAGALPPAPLAGYSAPGPGGPLPVIGPDGRWPADVYARPFTDSGKPKIAVVVGGLGLDEKRTRQAIAQLPPAVTLSFAPYAQNLQGWIDAARAAGHEVLLEAPMEPADFPENDPGPYTLMAGAQPAETQRRLDQILAKASGYFGVTNYLGGRFVNAPEAMDAFTGQLARRGLAFVDDGQAARVRGGGLPRASADRVIDEDPSAEAIDRRLLLLEAAALQNGQALGAGFAYPVTLDQVSRWAAGLEARGYALAPASALTRR